MKELICYNSDSSRIHGTAIDVVFPVNENEVRNIINSSIDIVPRGFGRNLVGGCIPNNSVVVDMKKMNKVIFDYKSKTVIAESGVTVKELNEKLKSVGFEFPIFEEATIGGLVAMNSSGIMGKYGNIKEWIDEIEFVNGKGEIINVKKADFGDVCGLEGITGIITKVKLKLIPLTEKSFSIFQSENIDDVFSIARRLRSEKDVVMLRLYSKYVSRLLDFPEKYNLIVCFNSNRGKIKKEDYKRLFNKIKRDYYYLYDDGYYEIEDPKLFFDKMKEFILFLERLNIPYIGDLNLNIIFPFFKDKIKKDEVLKIISKMDGKPGKFGIGLKRKDRLDDINRKIIQRIKLRHDPSGKLNKGKLLDLKQKYSLEPTVYFDKLDNNKEIMEKKELENDEDKIEKGKIVMTNNLYRKPKIKISENDKELINKIMFNKLDNENKENKIGDKKLDNKKEENE